MGIYAVLPRAPPSVVAGPAVHRPAEGNLQPPACWELTLKRRVYQVLGLGCVGLGVVGPFALLPTTPFLILAAYFFSRSHPGWARLLAHPRVGPAIRAWRDHRAIPGRAKAAATVLLAISAGGGWFALTPPWSLRAGRNRGGAPLDVDGPTA